MVNQIISTAADSSDLAAHGYAHGICSRRSTWLRLTGLKPEVQRKIMNLPFNGSSLCGAHADDEVSKMKTELDTLKAIGLEKKKDFRRRFHQYDKCPFQQRSQTTTWSSQNQGQNQQRPRLQQRRPGRGRGGNNKPQLRSSHRNNEIHLLPKPLSTPVGGSISLHLEEWKRITKDNWVINIVENGYLLKFKSPPPPTPPRGIFCRAQHLLQAEVNLLLAKGSIENVPAPERNQGIHSRYFLVQKRGPTTEYRPIFCLRLLNRYICREKFRMLVLHQIFPHLHQGD